jgi:exodeoxyribonuclease VII small subunit
VSQTPELSYEAAREELIEVVRRLESGSSTLEESLSLWERGEQLAAICQTWLDGARARLDQAAASASAATTENGAGTNDTADAG